MTRETPQGRLAVAQAQQQTLLQQRARLTELLDQALAGLNQSQGRIAELRELPAETEAQAQALEFPAAVAAGSNHSSDTLPAVVDGGA